jgi:uncharacterized membrane protein
MKLHYDSSLASKGIFLAVTIALVTIAGGMIHGRLEHRWGTPEKLVALAAELERLPQNIGLWRLSKSTDIAPEVQEMLRTAGYINRTYIHAKTGAQVRVAILVGPTATIAMHTPEICYSSRAAVVHQSRQRVRIASAADRYDELWHLVFRPTSDIPDDIHVFYGWSTGDGWVAPDSQRLAFIGVPWLYKIQLAARASEQADSNGKAVGEDFLSQFIPALQRTMTLPASQSELSK